MSGSLGGRHRGAAAPRLAVPHRASPTAKTQIPVTITGWWPVVPTAASTTLGSAQLPMTSDEIDNGDFWIAVLFAHRSSGGDDLTIEPTLDHAAFTAPVTFSLVSTLPIAAGASADLAVYIGNPVAVDANGGAGSALSADIARDYSPFFYKLSGATSATYNDAFTEATATTYTVDWTTDPGPAPAGSAIFHTLLSDGLWNPAVEPAVVIDPSSAIQNGSQIGVGTGASCAVINVPEIAGPSNLYNIVSSELGLVTPLDSLSFAFSFAP